MTDEAMEAARRMRQELGVSPIDVGRLGEATPPDQIRQRQGNKQHGGDCDKQYGVCQLQHRMLDYIDARFVMRRLDEVIGPEFWQRDHRMEGAKVACGIGIKIDGEWVWRWDGAGETDIEGEKGSFSDSFKRAGACWGIARDLYPEPNHNAPRADAGRVSPSARPAPAQSEQGDGPPKCPLHGWPMKPSRNGQGWFCSTRAKEGEPQKNGYCIEKVG